MVDRSLPHDRSRGRWITGSALQAMDVFVGVRKLFPEEAYGVGKGTLLTGSALQAMDVIVDLRQLFSGEGFGEKFWGRRGGPCYQFSLQMAYFSAGCTWSKSRQVASRISCASVKWQCMAHHWAHECLNPQCVHAFLSTFESAKTSIVYRVISAMVLTETGFLC